MFLLGCLIFIATLVLVITRPRGVPEWAAALGGGAGMLLLGIVTFEQAARVLWDNLNVFGFFLGLMTISALAESAGFFDALARLAARLSGNSSRRLFLNVMLIGTVITVFLTNDATALILTPLVFALVVRLRLEPLPFMFATTFIADTASFVLPVSNPINVLVLTAFPHDLWSYLGHLLLPAMLVIAGNIAIFLWIFRHDLRRSFDPMLLDSAYGAAVPVQGRWFRYAAASLGGIALAYVLASAFRWPLAFVAVGGALLLLLGGVAMRRVQWRELGKGISWPIFGFIGGMLLLVQGVENLGITAAFGHWLVALSGGTTWGAVPASVIGSAVGANAINNVPMALVMTSAIRSVAPTGPLNDVFVYGTIVGADLGPNITTVGSLATMLWLLILRRRGLDVSPLAYFRLGIVVTPVLLVLAILALWLTSR
jgi:arsenical pump membrane protein